MSIGLTGRLLAKKTSGHPSARFCGKCIWRRWGIQGYSGFRNFGRNSDFFQNPKRNQNRNAS